MELLQMVFAVLIFILGWAFGRNGTLSTEQVIKINDKARTNAIKHYDDGRYAGIAHGQSALNGYQAGQQSVLEESYYDGSEPPPDEEPEPTKH